MALGTIKGRGSLLRFMVMTDLTRDPSGNYKKPATFAASALSLPEVTTSDIPVSVAEDNTPAPVMYGSPAPGAGEQWKDSEPGEASWTVSFSGNVQPVEADRAAMQALRLAQTTRSILWVERLFNGETIAEGGAGFITSASLPVPAGDPETFSMTFTGKGKFFLDASTATSAT